MDSKRLTDERLQEIVGNYDKGFACRSDEAETIARELLLLRADAAELARAVSDLRDAHRIHLSLCGQRPHPTDGLYVNTGKILERPSVVNLMKEKDQ